MIGFPSILGLVSEGGVFLFLIAGLLAGGIAIIVERFLAIARASHAVPRGLVSETLSNVERGAAASALDTCRGLHGLLPTTLSKVLTEATAGDGPVAPERLRERAENTLTLQAIHLSKRLDLLSTAGNMATLIGLLATVVALREAFGPQIASGSLPITGALGAGVSRALVATGFGIAAAIPLLLAQSYLRGRVDSLLNEARAASEDVIDALVKVWRSEEAERRALRMREGAAAKGRERRVRDRQAVEERQPQTVGH